MANLILIVLAIVVGLWILGAVLTALERAMTIASQEWNSSVTSASKGWRGLRESTRGLLIWGGPIAVVLIWVSLGWRWEVAMGLDGVVAESPYFGWLVTGIAIGAVASVLLRVHMFDWPFGLNKFLGIADIEHLGAGVRAADKYFRVRLFVALPILGIGAVLLVLSTVVARAYPWRETGEKKVEVLSLSVGHPESFRSVVILGAALGDALGAIAKGDESQLLESHITALRLLGILGSIQSSEVYELRVRAQAKRQLQTYSADTNKAVQMRQPNGLVRAKAMSTVGLVEGDLLLGQAYAQGLVSGDGKCDLAYQAFAKAQESKVKDASANQEQLVKRILLLSKETKCRALAYSHLEAQAKDGNANAQVWLGYRYRTGDGIQPDVQVAKYWFALAANQTANGAARERATLALEEITKNAKQP